MQSPKTIPVHTALGIFLLEFSAKGLYAVRFPKGTGSFFGKRDRHLFLRKRSLSLRKKCLSPLLRMFRNAKLDLTGYTPFQRKVYAALRKVPAGKVISYGGLAKRAGYPGAGRAVGTAMKKNRLPIVIPCHRVVCRDGSVGQYSAGKKWKRFLLDREQPFAQRATVNAQR